MILDLENIKKYVINLDRRRDRLEIFLEECSRFFSSTDVERVSGIEPGNGAPANAQPRLCIAISFQKAMKHALDSNQEWALIMEDDCWFPSVNARTYADTCFKHVCDDVDVLAGGIYTSAGLEPTGSKNWLRTKECSGTHFMVYNRKAMYKILSEDFSKNIFHIDRFLARPTELLGAGLTVHVAAQFFALQKEGFSDNVGKQVQYEKLLSRFTLLK